ncbi:MFS transporter [Sulfitobacter sp. KE29]|uniref:MFS transporter n=1 Tax=unclassified Sulfitobacter TaxID=196795 RepID=UPI0023E2EF97|nr:MULTISPECIES: MFS transporter [unclassified Sulfitobacter]MDF3420260.1 MFS transporter [Sulfitobacter sp. Ks38]MDF3427745.1 MFS transporter [Sulfitobacter sp. KE29]MDF3431324.1 MFS transporter [Sulfitobacter sp. S46]MDF3446098.1 MFS transporter [Sulfitobacter sp. KE31]MDF3550106.1 MFS transporter [Sulfitobacter sp. KE28]
MTYFQSLSAAGFAATAISFGPARMGFGLFVPEFKSVFSMSQSMVGLVSSIGFAGFFVGLLIAQFLLNRRGPEFPVLSGLIAATIGLGIVALAPTIPVLATGVFVAASSAGLAWTPFNDAVHRKVGEVDRPTALSKISTGTSLGIAAAGAVALAMVLIGFNWRVCWGIFAGTSALALIGNWAALRQVEKDQQDGPAPSWRDLMRREAVPLFAVAFIFGITSAIYISFAADHFAQKGVPGMPKGATPALVFIAYGIFGLIGLLAGRARNLMGLPWLLRGLLAIATGSLVLAASLAGSWGGLITSAGLQGVNVMMTSAVLAFWSERLFPSLPSMSFTATVLFMAAGSVFGPVLAGLVSKEFGPDAMLYGAALIPLTAAVALRDRLVSERPVA